MIRNFTFSKRTVVLCAAGLIGLSQLLSSCQKGNDTPNISGNASDVNGNTPITNQVYSDVEYTSMMGYLSAARTDIGATTVGNKTYFVGGFDFSNNLAPRVLPAIDVFDGGNLGWTTERFPAGHEEGAFKVAGSKVFFTGPKNPADNNPSNQIEAYDLITKNTTVYEFSKAYFVKFAKVWGNQGIFAGDADVEVIDLNTKTRVSAQLPTTATIVDMAVWKGKAYFIVKGENKVYVYDLAANSWTNLTVGDTFQYINATDDKLILLTSNASTFHVLDLTTNAQKSFSLSTGRIQPNIIVAGNKVLFAGGIYMTNGQGSSTELVDIFDTRTNAITNKNMSEKRLGAAGAVNGNFVLIAGGYELGTKTPFPVFRTVDFFYLKK